jgi:predicted DNA-binding transcriptional regulator YafY
MPKNKNAAIRYRIIDKMLRNKYRLYPTLQNLIDAVREYTDGILEVSESSIQKDIQAMKSPDLFSAPIVFSRKEKGYYYDDGTGKRDESFSIDGVPLNDAEISAIKLAAGILKQFQGTEFMSGYESAIDKILTKIDVTQNPEIESIIQVEQTPASTGSEFINPLIQLISERLTVQFEYTKFYKEKSEIYTVHPYLIREYRNRWYLIGLDDLKKEIRTFGLDRISNLVQASGIKYIRDTKFKPEVYFKYALGISVFNDRAPEEIQLSFKPFTGKYIKTQPWHDTQEEMVNNEKEYRIKLKLMPSMELIREVRSYGNDVKVLKPEWLKNEVEGKR